jgi:Recombination endonuclease VII
MYFYIMKYKIIEQEVIDRLEKGMTYRQIKEELKCSLGTIYNINYPYKKEERNSKQRSKYIPHPKKKINRSKEEIKLNALKRMLKHRYNLSYEKYLQIYNEQNGCCAICKTPKKLGGKKGLLIDHNHKTMEIRGLLCTNCNNGIGKFKDSIELMKNAIDYCSRFTNNEQK